jgi:hypothetical protein
MSVFKAVDTLNPYAKSDKVLNIILDSQSDAYILRNLIHEAGTYIFAIWVKTDSNSTVNFKILGTDVSFEATDSWQLFTKRIDADSSDKSVEIKPQVNINSYFYEGFLSKGTTFTGWSPAPEDVDEGINNAQSSADKANTNASNAQQNANNALDAANKADAKADQAKSDAAAASSAAQIAKKQADEAQRKSNTANDIANGAVATISPIAQVVIVDDKGLKILNSENNTSYAQMQSTGLFVFVNKEQRAVFGATSKVENMAIQDYLMFGSHRAETKIENGEEGTAFFHIGDVK